MPTHDYPHRNLVFEGGGVKGVAYGGVFEVLEQTEITPQIQSVAGTSAGAITATMMSLNYSAEEFLKIMMTLNFEKFEDGFAITRCEFNSSPRHSQLIFPLETKQMELPPFGAPVHLGRVRQTHETSVFFSR